MRADPRRGGGVWLLRIATAVSALLGLASLAGGTWLVARGGSPYYLLAGVAMLVTAWLLARRHPLALYPYAALMFATLIWAVAEIGFDWWQLVPRGDLIFLLGVLLMLPAITRRLSPAPWRRTAGPLAIMLGVVVLVAGVPAFIRARDLPGTLPGARTRFAANHATVADGDWTTYGRSWRGDKWSPLSLPFRMGVPSLGGPMMTVGGVAFLSSAIDHYVRAYDVTSGRVLCCAHLPAGGQATPMSYWPAKSGRQFVMVVAGSHATLGTRLRDHVIAHALPPHKMNGAAVPQPANHNRQVTPARLERVIPLLGWIATGTAVMMYVSYIAQIRLNLSGQPGSVIQPFATVVNCALWVAYGLLKPKRDWPVALANAPGVLLGAITLVTALHARV